VLELNAFVRRMTQKNLENLDPYDCVECGKNYCWDECPVLAVDTETEGASRNPESGDKSGKTIKIIYFEDDEESDSDESDFDEMEKEEMEEMIRIKSEPFNSTFEPEITGESGDFEEVPRPEVKRVRKRKLVNRCQ
jgi:hypothetical protein